MQNQKSKHNISFQSISRFKLRRRFILQLFISFFIAHYQVQAMPAAGQQCFNYKFPKIIQSSSLEAENHAEAVTKHDGLQSLFVGGYITQLQLNPSTVLNNEWAHIGRIWLHNNVWLWTKIMRQSSSGESLTTVSALSVDPAGTKVAAFGHNPALGSGGNGVVGFIFTLDALTGASRSKLMRIQYVIDYFDIQSAGMIFQDDGTIFMTAERAEPNSSTYPYMRIASFDSIRSSLNYYKETDKLGHSASLVQAPDYLYIGGSFSLSTATNEPWLLAFMKIPNAELAAGPLQAQTSILSYQHISCGTFGDYTNRDHAPYIRHIGFDDQNGVKQIFGLAQSNAYGAYGHGLYPLVFRAELDPNGDVDVSNLPGYRAVRMPSSVLGISNKYGQFIGMRSQMEKAGSSYFVHCIFTNDNKDTYYTRISPDLPNQSSYFVPMYEDSTDNFAYEAVFAGSNVAYLSTRIHQGFESYAVGQMQKYTTIGSQQNFQVKSYAVWSTFSRNNPNNCVEYKILPHGSDSFTLTFPDSCKVVETQVQNLHDVTSFTLTTEKLLLFDLQFSNQRSQGQCNSGGQTIRDWEAGANPPNQEIVFNYGNPVTVTFQPNKILDPPNCNDEYWLYQAFPPSSLPDYIQISLQSEANQIMVSQKDSDTFGYQNGFIGSASYTIVVMGLLDLNTVEVQHAFNVNLVIDCCAAPTILTAPTTPQTHYTYTIGDPALVIILSGDWVSDNSCCTLITAPPIVQPSTASAAFRWDSLTRSVTVSSSDDSPSGPSGQIYRFIIHHEFRPYANQSPAVQFDVEILGINDLVDPCESDTLTLDASGYLFRTPPVYSYNLAVGEPSQSITVSDGESISSTLLDLSICGTIQKEFWDVTGGVESALDPEIFSQTDKNTLTELWIKADQMEQVGIYNLRLVVYYTDYPNIFDRKEFIVNIYNPCRILTPVTNLAEQEYYVGSGTAFYDVQTIADNGFKVSNKVCGGIEFAAQFFKRASQFSPDTSSSSSGSSLETVEVPFIINENTEVIRMSPFGDIEIFTNDSKLVGQYDLYITARMSDFPDIITQSATQIPVEFKRCSVIVKPWEMQDLTIPVLTSLQYPLGGPIFTYQNPLLNCNYSWERFTVTFSAHESGGEDLDIDISNVIKFDQATRSIVCQALALSQPQVIIVDVQANLSDEMTFVTSSFLISFQTQESRENQAPYFDKTPQSLYTIVFTDDNDELEQVIELGLIRDERSGEVHQEFVCPKCKQTEINMAYDRQKNIISVPRDVPIGAYQVMIKLSDKDEKDPKSTQYFMTISVQADASSDVSVQSEAPSFSLEKFSYVGELQISFSQKLKVPEDLTQVNPDAIEFRLVADISSTVTDRQLLEFTWSVKSFSEQGMTILVTFVDPASISSGVQRDRWIATVRDPELFVSVETFLRIPMNASDTIKVPKMMANTELTEQFVAVSDGMGTLVGTTLVSSYFINFLLEGTMHLLWGLIHCLQIVAHYPMLDIMLPSNAHQVFSVIMQIAQFNIVPLQKAMADAEVKLGIENDSYVHSDNFEDFGYDTSDVILNLQIMFIFILILLALPIILTLARWCCKRKKKCVSYLNWIGKRIFWSTYIRFILESFLEIALAGILRLKNFSFVSGSEFFHSAVAIIFLIIVTIFMIGSTVVLQLNQRRLSDKDFKEKYGELTLGLKNTSNMDIKLATKVYNETHDKLLKLEQAKYNRKGADFSMVCSPKQSETKEARRMNEIFVEKYKELQNDMKATYRLALLYPTFFMIRRLVYAVILVFLLNMTYFQIQLVILKTALFGAYMGYFQVFEQRSQNRLEIANESFTMMCSYCLIPFSGLVSDSETRYICGWPLITLVFLLLTLNLTIIIAQTISLIIHTCKLRMQKRRNLKSMKSRVQLKMAKINEQVRLQREFRPEDNFCNLDGFGSVAKKAMVPQMQSQLVPGIETKNLSRQLHSSQKTQRPTFMPYGSHELVQMNSSRSRTNILESLSSEELSVNYHPNIRLLKNQQRPETSKEQRGLATKATRVFPIDQFSEAATKRTLLPMCSKSREIRYDDLDDVDNSHMFDNESCYQVQLSSVDRRTSVADYESSRNLSSSMANTAIHSPRLESSAISHRSIESTANLVRARTEHKSSNFLSVRSNTCKSSDNHIE